MRPTLLGFAVAILSAGTGAAEAADRGFYFGADLGVSEARPLKSTRTNVGIPTNCDQWLDPVVIGGTSLPLPADLCQPRSLPSSASEFDLGADLLFRKPSLQFSLNTWYILRRLDHSTPISEALKLVTLNHFCLLTKAAV